MKRQIRCRVFETNSSSTHSLTMCSNEEFEKWKRGEILYWGGRNKFATYEEILAELKTAYYSWYDDVDWDDEDAVSDILSDEGINSYSEFFYDNYYETYIRRHTTAGGEKIVAFGYCGYN